MNEIQIQALLQKAFAFWPNSSAEELGLLRKLLERYINRIDLSEILEKARLKKDTKTIPLNLIHEMLDEADYFCRIRQKKYIHCFYFYRKKKNHCYEISIEASDEFDAAEQLRRYIQSHYPNKSYDDFSVFVGDKAILYGRVLYKKHKETFTEHTHDGRQRL